MVTLSTNTPRTGLFAGLVLRFKEARARHDAYARTFDELNRLTDRELNDIGIGRGDIREIALEEAKRF